MNRKNITKFFYVALLFGGTAAISLNSCTEKIDDSDLYTFTGEMMTDHFVNNPDRFSSYLKILNRVTPSKRSKSSMSELLSARGHYTCFAPTNEAIAHYIDSLYRMEKPQVSSLSLDELPDSVAKSIVFNSIIENGSSEAYATTDFEIGALGTTNMNDRYISISYGTEVANVTESGDTALNTTIYVNTNSKIIEGDIEVENGYIHVVDHVLSPSTATIADLVISTPNMRFFGDLLKKTGWNSKLTTYKDEAWEETYDDVRGTTYNGMNGGWEGLFPEHRYTSFTIFVEPDSVYQNYGITDLESLKQWVMDNNNFDDDTNCGHQTSWGDDYSDDYNWLNQFVAYHILPERLTYNNMVTFANEYGCDASMMKTRTSSQFYVNVWEYWETVGIQRRSVKITGCRPAGGGGVIQRRINRNSVYNQKTYKENSGEMKPEDQGIRISDSNEDYDNNALNGYYYPIDDILIWNKRVPNTILNERLRYDITALFPELMTNNIRQNRINSWYFNEDKIGRYLTGIVDMGSGTDFEYLPNTSYSTGLGSWMDYQIDEFNIRGKYDFTMKLPPVPYTGTYEIRYGVWANENRGMAQIYFGENYKNLPAIGIPIDLRSGSGTSTASTGWVAESTIAPTGTDSTALFENQKTMRNMGFMKGPKYVQVSGGTARDSQNNLRKIIYTGQLEAGKTYYIRFKSVLSSTSTEFFFDYLEFVPKSVYAGESNEDIW
ncbi:MAG: fasciclin domain-containing protein [Bacteroidaceae bacterium]|nr:fasciclin domain-containing protein [Bacteroidaceae bacterium]